MAKTQEVMAVGRELAGIVQAARKRVYWCDQHQRVQRPHCQDCIVEAVFGMQIRSLSEIMGW